MLSSQLRSPQPLVPPRSSWWLLVVSCLFLFLFPVLFVNGSAAPHHETRRDSATAFPPFSVCLEVSMSTPSPCADDPDFLDVVSYDCASEAGFDCWAYNLFWSIPVEGVRDIVRNCPLSCGLCAWSDDVRMTLELRDLSSSAPPVLQYPLPSGASPDFDGFGPPLSSDPSAAVVQTACVPFPGCYSARMSAGTDAQFSEFSRTSFSISLLSSSSDDPSAAPTLVLSASETSNWFDFCLSDCPSNTPYQHASGLCLPCPPGTYNDPVKRACIACPRNSYSGSSGASGCTPCPERFSFSSKGSTSESECFAKNANVYAVSPDSERINAYNPDAENFVAVIDDDGIMNMPLEMVFVDSNIFLVANEFGGNLVMYDGPSGEYLGNFANVANPTSIVVMPGGKQIAVASASDEALYVYDLDIVTSPNANAGDGYEKEEGATIIYTVSIPGVNWVALGENDDEILVTTLTEEVFRRCITLNCVRAEEGTAARDELMLWGDPGEVLGMQQIRVIRSRGVYLVATKEVVNEAGVYDAYAMGRVLRAA